MTSRKGYDSLAAVIPLSSYREKTVKPNIGDKIVTATAGAVGAFAGLLAGLLLPGQDSDTAHACRDTSTAAVASLNAYDEYLDAVLDNKDNPGKLDSKKVKEWESQIDRYNNVLWDLYPDCAE